MCTRLDWVLERDRLVRTSQGSSGVDVSAGEATAPSVGSCRLATGSVPSGRVAGTAPALGAKKESSVLLFMAAAHATVYRYSSV